jgi:hypothetical protein
LSFRRKEKSHNENTNPLKLPVFKRLEALKYPIKEEKAPRKN